MKITNKLGLPDMLVRAVEKDYQYQDKRYSITSLLQPSRELMLKRRYNNDIEQDVSDCIWMLFGTFTHFALEKIELKENEYVEKHLERIFENGYTLSGIIDHIYDTVDDYKTTSVWSIIYKSDFEKWKKQLQLGAYLWFKESGIFINKGKIIAILKDYNKKEAIGKEDYPKLPVEVIEFDLGTVEEIEQWLTDKFNEIQQLEKMHDHELPMCSMEERFNKGNKYAVKKIGNVKAFKVHDTLENAEAHIQELGSNYEIEERLGEDTKCLNYCSVCKFCPYYLEKYDQDIKEISEELVRE